MRRRHTRATDPDLYGPAVQRAVRIPETQVDAVQTVIARGVPDIHTVTDAIIDALWLWLYENDRVNGHEAGPTITNLGVAATAFTDGSVMTTTANGTTVSEPEQAPEPTEADRAYAGTLERPRWADVDPDALDVDP